MKDLLYAFEGEKIAVYASEGEKIVPYAFGREIPTVRF